MTQRGLRRFLAVLLTVALVLGQGAMIPVGLGGAESGQARAASAMPEGCPMMSKAKAEPSSKAHDAGLSCAAACAAISHVVLSSVESVLVRYATRVSFAYLDVGAVGLTLAPDQPPPRV